MCSDIFGAEITKILCSTHCAFVSRETNRQLRPLQRSPWRKLMAVLVLARLSLQAVAYEVLSLWLLLLPWP